MKRTNKEIRARILEIQGRLEVIEQETNNEEATAEQLADLTEEVEKLQEEMEELQEESRNLLKETFERGKEVKNMTLEERKKQQEAIEQRGRDYKIQNRVVQLGSLDIIKPKHTSLTLNDTFESVSDLVDRVLVTNVQGGESYDKGYVKSYATGNVTAEGVAYADTEPVFGYAPMTKVKVTAYTEVSEELLKLAPEAYAEVVERNLGIAIRRKLVSEILAGAGGTGKFTGIFASPGAITASKDKGISAINENTLDEIVLAYGSDEDISEAVLILSKGALLEFAKVRGTQDKKRVYDIDYKNKTINGVPFIITSALKSVANASAGEFVMAYGAPTNYEMALFSPIEAQMSNDFKFKNGQVAYKASGFFGGNVTVAEGFLRIKKSA